MKRHDILQKGILLLVGVFLILHLQAQNTRQEKQQKKSTEIRNCIQTKNLVFTAQTVLPQTVRVVNLTTTYEMQVAGDSLISDLPYFGRAYQAPVNPEDDGIHFRSVQFNYTIKDRKKGGWDITIEPKDTKDVRQMFLTVFENGYATLNVISNYRQKISYNGYIKAAHKV